MFLRIDIEIKGPVTDFADIKNFLDSLINATGERYGAFDIAEDAPKLFHGRTVEGDLIIAEAGSMVEDTAQNRAWVAQADEVDSVSARISVVDRDMDGTMYNVLDAKARGSAVTVVMGEISTKCPPESEPATS